MRGYRPSSDVGSYLSPSRPTVAGPVNFATLPPSQGAQAELSSPRLMVMLNAFTPTADPAPACDHRSRNRRAWRSRLIILQRLGYKQSLGVGTARAPRPFTLMSKSPFRRLYSRISAPSVDKGPANYDIAAIVARLKGFASTAGISLIQLRTPAGERVIYEPATSSVRSDIGTTHATGL